MVGEGVRVWVSLVGGPRCWQQSRTHPRHLPGERTWCHTPAVVIALDVNHWPVLPTMPDKGQRSPSHPPTYFCHRAQAALGRQMSKESSCEVPGWHWRPGYTATEIQACSGQLCVGVDEQHGSTSIGVEGFGPRFRYRERLPPQQGGRGRGGWREVTRSSDAGLSGVSADLQRGRPCGPSRVVATAGVPTASP